ncbi:MAG: hypothetical protein ACI81R_001469, partial [Bradymonadia bacterium]
MQGSTRALGSTRDRSLFRPVAHGFAASALAALVLSGCTRPDAEAPAVTQSPLPVEEASPEVPVRCESLSPAQCAEAAIRDLVRTDSGREALAEELEYGCAGD